MKGDAAAGPRNDKWDTMMMRSMTIEGKKFDLTVREQPTQETWHWIITAPGELVLSGEAGSEIQAMRSACRAGRAFARLVA